MSVDLTHPLVADYLHPLSRRTDLVAEIREHLTDALAGTGEGVDGEAAVRAVLDRLGTPDEIVAAETPGVGEEAAASSVRPVGQPAWAAAPPAWAAPPTWAAPPGPVPGRSPWGPVEVIAVVGLTLGTFLLPVVGPLIGIACAWVSDRWTRREKVVATLWTLAAPLVLVLVATAGLLAFRVQAGPAGTVEQAPVPVASEMLVPGPTDLVTP
jgi:hypothetical protein